MSVQRMALPLGRLHSGWLTWRHRPSCRLQQAPVDRPPAVPLPRQLPAGAHRRLPQRRHHLQRDHCRRQGQQTTDQPSCWWGRPCACLAASRCACPPALHTHCRGQTQRLANVNKVEHERAHSDAVGRWLELDSPSGAMWPLCREAMGVPRSSKVGITSTRVSARVEPGKCFRRSKARAVPFPPRSPASSSSSSSPPAGLPVPTDRPASASRRIDSSWCRLPGAHASDPPVVPPVSSTEGRRRAGAVMAAAAPTATTSTALLPALKLAPEAGGAALALPPLAAAMSRCSRSYLAVSPSI